MMARTKGPHLDLPRLAGNIPQIDVLKGLAIVAVLLLHAIPTHELFGSWAPLHLGQAVPIFIVIMGINAFGSSARRGIATLRDAYTRDYVIGRIDRIYVPFLVIYAVSLAAKLIGGEHRPGFLAGLVSGELPSSGPGNYFIGLIFQFALLGPALYLAYRRWPRATLLASFAASALFDLAAPHVGLFSSQEYLYSAAIVRFAPFIVCGIAVGERMVRGEGLGVWWLAGAVVSFAYLLAVSIDGTLVPLAVRDWRPWGQTSLSVFYTVALVALGLRYLPTATPSARLLAVLGRASYHIFLVQILWYSAFGDRGLLIAPLDVVVCCAIGWAFWRAMERVPTLGARRAQVAERAVAAG